MTSVVIPAHDEAAVIERCLRTLLDGAEDGELEVVVVANGCTDDTADRARAFGPPVAVVETPIASKHHALNLGDRHARRFPRVYLDADICLDIDAVRDLRDLLDGPDDVVLAAPKAVVDVTSCSLGVRAFYRVWTRLPYVTEDMVGAGVYAFSRRGRDRFGEFPAIVADDEFARRLAAPGERRSSPRSTFTIHPPRTLRGVVRIMTRSRSGNAELARTDAPGGEPRTGLRRTLSAIARNPATWPGAPVYVAAMATAEARARMRGRDGRDAWLRDDSSRLGTPPRGSCGPFVPVGDSADGTTRVPGPPSQTGGHHQPAHLRPGRR